MTRSGLIGFWHWWRGELEGWMGSHGEPPATASLADGVLTIRSPSGALVLRTLAGHAAPGALRLRSRSIAVEVPPDRVIVRDVQLPEAAGPHLERVVGYEIRRWSPFGADRTLFDVMRLPEPLPRRGFLTARLTLCSIAEIANTHDALTEAGLVERGDRIRLRSESGGTRAMLSVAASRRSRSRHLLRMLWALNALAAIAVLIVPLVWLDQETRRRSSQLAELGPRLDAVRELADRRRAAATALAHIDTFEQESAPPLELLESVTRAMPDTAYLDSLQWHDGGLVLRGVGAEAARLVGEVEADSAFSDVRMTAPLVRLHNNGARDRFELSVRHGARP